MAAEGAGCGALAWEQASPGKTAGPLARLYFSWLTPFMRLSADRALAQDDVFQLCEEDCSAFQNREVQRHWSRLRGEGKPGGAATLLHALWCVNGGLFLVSQSLKLLQILANFVPPLILSNLLDYVAAGAVHAAMPAWYISTVDYGMCRGNNGNNVVCRFLLADGLSGGMVLIIGIFLFQCLQSVLQQHFQFRSQRVGLRMQSAVSLMIFDKAMRYHALGKGSARAADGETAAGAATISASAATSRASRGASSGKTAKSSSKEHHAEGKVVNMASTDAQRLFSFVGYSVDAVWGGPLQIALAMYFLVDVIGGWATLACLATIFASMPLTIFFAQIIRRVQKKKMASKDRRVSLTDEALKAASIVKASGWEALFVNRINKAREVELGFLLKYGLVSGAFGVLFMALPSVLTFVAIYTFSAVQGGGTLPATVAFVSSQYINRLRLPLIQLPSAMSQMLEMGVALGRISGFLSAPELDMATIYRGGEIPSYLDGNGDQRSVTEEETPMDVPLAGATGGPLLFMAAATFVWTHDESEEEADDASNNATAHAFALQDIDLELRPGNIVAVVGSVGSGKSSLLFAALGEMRMVVGDDKGYTPAISPGVRVAYVPQKPFVMNATLRENILFGRTYNASVYSAALTACALESDIAMLPNGDLTEIGEMGVGLSGGQKQRVALARAVYTLAGVDTDERILFLLDDPLSAVDAHVGEHIFQHAVLDLMMGRSTSLLHRILPDIGGDPKRHAVLLVTHGLHFARRCERVVSLRHGRIVGMGSYNELAGQDLLFAASRDVSLSDLTEEVAVAEIAERTDDSSALADRGNDTTVHLSDDDDEEDMASGRSSSAGNSRSLRDILVNAGSPPPGSKLERALSLETSSVPYASPRESFDINDGNGLESKTEEPQRTPVNVADAPAADPAADGAADSEAKKDEEATNGAGTLIQEESRGRGAISYHVYKRYFEAAGGAAVGIVLVVLIIFGNSLPSVVQYFLKLWVDDDLHTTQALYQVGYAVLTIISLALLLARNVGMTFASQRASRVLHTKLLNGILFAPTAFFHTTPIGRILNRFASDMEQVDESVSSVLLNFVGLLATCASSVVSVVVVLPAFLLAIPPIAHLYKLTGTFFLRTSREVKRLSSTARSPVFKALSEAIAGADTYRAYGRVPELVAAHALRVDGASRSFFLGQLLNRWLSVRLDLMGALMVMAASLLVVVPVHGGIGGPTWVRLLLGGGDTAGTAGLAISQSMSVTSLLGFLVMLASQLEVTVVAAERLIEYADVKSESDRLNDASGDQRDGVSVATAPPAEWPATGALRFERVGMRYRPSTPRVLVDVSFDVPARSRVGICGRTGSGKSSLLVRLLRLADVNEGTIWLDGVDIDAVSLHMLRSRCVSLIPQESVLFSGTVRFNLDPESSHSDAVLLESLRAVRLLDVIRENAANLEVEGVPSSDATTTAATSAIQELLDIPVADNGANFSLGMRQLVCVARALVRKSAVVALDEATASCDAATDAILQVAIRTSFENATLLVVAHRIGTIGDSDAIFVMDQGRLAEEGTPSELLGRPGSIYASLVAQATKHDAPPPIARE